MNDPINDYSRVCGILKYTGGKKDWVRLTRTLSNGSMSPVTLTNRPVGGTALFNGSKKVVAFTGSTARQGLGSQL